MMQRACMPCSPPTVRGLCYSSATCNKPSNPPYAAPYSPLTSTLISCCVLAYHSASTNHNTQTILQHGALPLNFAHDPDFFKLLRAVRWYGAASVPQGNNPNSSRYVSTYTPPPPADDTATDAVAIASCDAGTSAAAAAAGSGSVGATTRAQKAAAKRAERASSSGGGASGWIKAHMPHIRSRTAAVAAAAAQPGTSGLATPESLSAAATAAAAAAESAAAAAAASRRSSSRSASPAVSAKSSESAAAQAAAASLAREAVKAVVARAAAEAAAEDGSGFELQGAAAAAGVAPVVQAREPAVSPVGLVKPRGSAPVTPADGPSPGEY
jgi:hypothetical protein